jgi:glycosyltransferase involved in cell wall biosynthesis
MPKSKAISIPISQAGFPGGLTVLMAVYGRDDPSLFEMAIDSVFRNTLVPNAFVLVVDGPTPPGLGRTIRRAAERHGVCTLHLEENVGLAAALNHGLALVQTEWVARADADDFNMPYRFELQAQTLRRATHSLDLIGGAIVEVDRRGVPLACRDAPLNHDGIVQRLQTRNPFNHMTVAFRTAAVLKAGGYPPIYLKEDWGLWAAMIAQGARCANVSDVLVRATAGREMYRRRGGIRVARSEWALQQQLLRHGYKTRPLALLHGGARAAVALLPATARAWIYRLFLRRRPSSQELQVASNHLPSGEKIEDDR